MMTSCPDWEVLVRRRDEEGDFDQSAEWQEALAHYDGASMGGGCDCREQALHADPMLLFRRLPRLETSPTEIDDMRVAVRTLRRAAPPPQMQRMRQVRRISAIAAGLLFFFGALAWQDATDSLPTAAPATVASYVQDTALEVPMASSAVDELPLVEDVDPELGELIQFMDDEVSIVLVIAPSDEGDTASGLNV